MGRVGSGTVVSCCQVPCSVSFQSVTVLSPLVTARTRPDAFQLTRQQGAGKGGRGAASHLPPLSFQMTTSPSSLHAARAAFPALSPNETGHHATSRTHSLCRPDNTADTLQRSLPSSETVALWIRIAPSQPAVAIMRPRLAGAHETALTPCVQSSSMATDHTSDSPCVKILTRPSELAQASFRPKTVGAHAMPLTELLCCSKDSRGVHCPGACSDCTTTRLSKPQDASKEPN